MSNSTLKEVLVFEHEVDLSFSRGDIHGPDLHGVPNARIVDVHSHLNTHVVAQVRSKRAIGVHYVDLVGLQQRCEGQVRPRNGLENVHGKVRIETVGIGYERKRCFEIRALLG